MGGNGKCKKDYVNKCSRTSRHALNNTASQFAAHSYIVEASGLPFAAAFGFMLGLLLGFGLKLTLPSSSVSSLQSYLS